MTTGGCLCGKIRFSIQGESIGSGACYCKDCQAACGGAPAYAAVFQKADFTLIQGEAKLFWTESETGNRIGRAFCGDCGTPLYGLNESRPDYLPVMAGALDDNSQFKVMALSWVSAAKSWHSLDPGASQFEKNIPSE